MNTDSDTKISDAEEKISDAEEKKSDDTKISDVKEKKSDDTKILDSINDDSFKSKISGFFEGISLKYVLTVAGGALFCVLVVGAVLFIAEPSTNQPMPREPGSGGGTVIEESKRVHVKITDGMSTGEIADQLEDKGVISSSLKFRILSRLRGYDGQMKPGTYIFTTEMSYEEVFIKILSGEKYVVTLTIPEGFDVKQIAKRLYESDLADNEDFLKAAKDFTPYPYMKKHKDVFFAAEGFLFPDTYEIESDASVEDILKILADEFDRKLTPEMREKAEQMNLSIYDLTTLASLVEREVRYPEDRAIVAQVFLKRLQMKMPLQTDATLQYLMDTPKEDVSIEDTKINSPYNTYQHEGLPPGPIASPGLESINAVLNPADTDYLYFVADRSGRNHYANTYEEHLELVNQYR